MIHPLSSGAKRAIMGAVLGSWVLGMVVNELWASRQSAFAYWMASYLRGVPAMLAGWNLLLAPGVVARLWGMKPAARGDDPDLHPKWRFGEMLRLALFGATLAVGGTTAVVVATLKLLSGCIDPTLSWEACP